jgi:hypothetical protein
MSASTSRDPPIPSANEHLLLDVILVERRKRHVAIIFMDQNYNISITDPSHIINTPTLLNQPKT